MTRRLLFLLIFFLLVISLFYALSFYSSSYSLPSWRFTYYYRCFLFFLFSLLISSLLNHIFNFSPFTFYLFSSPPLPFTPPHFLLLFPLLSFSHLSSFSFSSSPPTPLSSKFSSFSSSLFPLISSSSFSSSPLLFPLPYFPFLPLLSSSLPILLN